MTFRETNSLLCERTRGWLSLRLDGELSDFERTLMDAHLRFCSECREFEREVAGFTVALREAVLEPVPAPVALPVPRRRAEPTVRVAAAAAAVLVAAGVGTVLGSFRGGGENTARVTSLRAAQSGDSLNALRDLRVAWLPAPPDIGASKPPLPTQV